MNRTIVPFSGKGACDKSVGFCIAFGKKTMSYPKAQIFCKGLNGRLVEIRNQEENDFVLKNTQVKKKILRHFLTSVANKD